jgi:N-acetyltransferase 10
LDSGWCAGYRYAIDNASADWAAAEAQVAGGGKAMVSVKSGTGVGAKRKADGVADGKDKGGEKKGTRRSKKVKR